jgi:hypothetical protein
MRYISNNMVSIRYKSGGHSFSTKELESLVGAGQSLEVVVITPKCVLVPATEYNSLHKVDYLTTMGVAPSVSECVVDTPVINNIVAVMSIDKEFAQTLLNLNIDFTFTTPLLSNETIEQGTIIELIDNTLFVRVYNKGLLFAEAMEVSSDADIIHILQRLNNIYDIYNMYARALGDTERITRICKRCFKHIDK